MIEIKKFEERFEFITRVQGIDVFDSRHAIEEFFNHFPGVKLGEYKRIVTDGLASILDRYGLDCHGNYMIISDSTEIRVPMEIRADRFTNQTTAIIPTTLAPWETFNLRKEVEVFVESNKKEFKTFELLKGFNYFSKGGKVFTDFEEVQVK